MAPPQFIPVRLNPEQQSVLQAASQAKAEADEEARRAEAHLKQLCFMAAGGEFRLSRGQTGELQLLVAEDSPGEDGPAPSPSEETPSEESPPEDTKEG